MKIIDSFRGSAMQAVAACGKQAVLFRLSCSLLLAVRKAVSPTAKARFNSGRECQRQACFLFFREETAICIRKSKALGYDGNTLSMTFPVHSGSGFPPNK